MSKHHRKIRSAAGDLDHCDVSDSREDKESAMEMSKLTSESGKGERRKPKRRRKLVAQGGSTKRRKESHQSNAQCISCDSDGSTAAATPTGGIVTSDTRDMQEWVELGVPDPVLRALHDLKFYRPTEIQKRTIPLAAGGNNDIIGAAETVSVKGEHYMYY